MKGIRLDNELVSRGMYASRAKAVAAIKSGLVTVNGVVVEKPSFVVSESDEIVAGALPYVSGRGSLKLARALEYFNVNPTGYVCLDVGASTGGFTEVLLSHGAVRVVAVDVGTAQLVPEIRDDARVLAMEQTDIRTLVPCCAVDLIVADVSFISLVDILPALQKWDSNQIIVLIKPQFEVPRSVAAKTNGIIRSVEMRQAAVDKVINAFSQCGYRCDGVIESPIRGGSGNIEYLAKFAR